VRFEATDELKGAEFEGVDLSGAHFHNVDLSGATVKEALLVNARLSGLINGLVVNDVEVAPLISAEMDRRYPERTALRPRDADGVRAAWSVIEDLWAATRARAAALPEATLHERVEDEWSFLETVRHLVFVTDVWVSGNILGRTAQFHPLGVAPSFIADPARMGIDVGADPSFDEVVLVREERMDIVRELVAGVTDEDLARTRGEHTMLRCLCTLFDEEWHHNWFANRDLDVLTAG
jgi:DinB superfamily/Pentapeptide repeats (8 copies)